MSAGEILLWIILPYAAVATFVVGTWWRYRADQFGWTSGVDAALRAEDPRLGRPGVPLRRARRRRRPRDRADDPEVVHRGGRHVRAHLPLVLGDRRRRRRRGLRRRLRRARLPAGTNVRVRRTTSRTDLLVYFLLVVLIGLGCWMTFAHNLITASPYDYRDSISAWWRSLFILQPDVEAVQGANTVYQVHAIIAWAFWALFPFSRLVHAWSIPLQYLGRPYILYRRRYATHVQPLAMSAPTQRETAPEPSSRSRRSRSRPASTPGACSARSAPTSRTPSTSRTSRPRRWSPSPCCSAR